jgi:hypothetical protein
MKDGMTQVLNAPLTDVEKEEVLTAMMNHFAIWDATGEPEIRAALNLAIQEGTRQEYLDDLIENNPIAKAFRLQVQARKLIQPLISLRGQLEQYTNDQYPSLSTMNTQYVSDVRLHEALDTAAINRYINEFIGEARFVIGQLQQLDREDKAGEVANLLRDAMKRLDNFPDDRANDLTRNSTFNTHHTRLPSLLPAIQDVFQGALDAAGFDSSGLDDINSLLTKTGSRTVSVPDTVLDDNGIPTTGDPNTAIDFLRAATSRSVAAGANPEWGYDVINGSDGNFVINISGPLSALDEAADFLPSLISSYIEYSYIDTWRNRERMRIENLVRESEQSAWRDAYSIPWEEIESFGNFEWINIDDPDSLSDDLLKIKTSRMVKSKEEYIATHIESEIDRTRWQAEDSINNAPMEKFTLPDGRTISRDLPEYAAKIDDSGDNSAAENWLNEELGKAKSLAISDAVQPGGWHHDKQRKELEKKYDDDPPGLMVGWIPNKIADPQPGFEHGNIESLTPVVISKKGPGGYWRLHMGLNVTEFFTDKQALTDVQREVAHHISQYTRYYATSSETYTAYEDGYNNYWKKFPNPFFDGSNVLREEDIPKKEEPNWDAVSKGISEAMGAPSETEESGGSEFLFNESIRLNKKATRNDWIPGMPMSDEDVRALFLKAIIADAVRRGVPRIAWSGGLASTKRGGNWEARWHDASEIKWTQEKMTIRGQEKEVIVLRGKTIGSSYLGPWNMPLVVDGSAQSLGTVLGHYERRAILDAIGGKNKDAKTHVIEPKKEDLLVSANHNGTVWYLTRVGANEVVYRGSSEEDVEAKRVELFEEAKAKGGWDSSEATGGPPEKSFYGGELLNSGVIRQGDFGLTPLRVLVGQTLSQIEPNMVGADNYIHTLDATTSRATDTYWWYQKGARFSYEQVTYKAWENVLKEFGASIDIGSILTNDYDSPFASSGRGPLGETRVPHTPLDLVQQHGPIRVERLAGQREGYVVTGADDLVLPQVYETEEKAIQAMDQFISQNSGDTTKAAKVFQITINDAMRAHFAKPQPFLHHDPYEDPILKSAADKIGSRLPRFRDRYEMWRKNWKDEAHQGMFDRFYGIKYALKRAELWKELDAENNPWIQARFTTSLDSVMKAVLEYGAPVWRDGITQTEGKGLIDVLQPVLGDVETWAMYMAGKRSRGLLLEGISSLTASEMKLLMKAANQYKGKTDRDKILALIADVTAEQDSVALDDVTYDRKTLLGKLIKKSKGTKEQFDKDRGKAKPLVEKIINNGRERNWRPYEIKRMAELGDHFTQFKKVAKDYAAFNKKVLDYAQEAGIINPDTRALWENADYIPFYRVVDNRLAGAMSPSAGIANQPSPIKHLGGSEDNVGDLMHNIMMNVTNLVDASMKNHAARMTVDALKESGIVQKQPMTFEQKMVSMDHVKKKLLERGLNPDAIPEDALSGFQKTFAISPPKGEGVLSIMRDGKKEYYYTDDDLLFRAMSAIDMQQFGEWMTLFRGPKRLLTAMVTLDPGFMLANFVRDTASAFVLSRDHFIPLVGAVRGFGQALVKDEAMRTMLSAGAAFESGYLNASDPYATHRLLKNAQKKPGFRQTIIRTPKSAWEAYKALGSAVENSNRMAVYNAAIAAGKSKAQAAFEAKDLMDFSMGGDWPFIQFLIQTVPFMGARLQGLHRLGRGFHDHPVAFLIKGSLLAAAGLALWAAFREDERYKALEEWDKDTYFHWWIGERHYRLPKPFEVGAIFNTIPERLFEHHYSEENDAGKLLIRRLGFMLGETFSMNPIPQTVKPFAEAYFNYNMFQGRDIVSPYEEQRMGPEQYRYSTSPTWVELARAMPAGVDLASTKIRSPLHIQNLYSGYMGTLGRYLVMGSDAFIRNQMGYPEPPAWRDSDYPVYGRFVRGDSPRRTKYEEEVYTLIRKVTNIQGSMRYLDKTEQFDRLDQIEDDWEAYIDIASDLEGIREDVQDVNKDIMHIWMDRKMTPIEKRERLDKLQREKNDLFREGWELRPGGAAGAGQRDLTMNDVKFMLDEWGVDDKKTAEAEAIAPATATLMQGIDTLGSRELERLAAIIKEEGSM